MLFSLTCQFDLACTKQSQLNCSPAERPSGVPVILQWFYSNVDSELSERCVLWLTLHIRTYKKTKKTNIQPPLPTWNWRVTLLIYYFCYTGSGCPSRHILLLLLLYVMVIICRSTVKDCTTFWLIYYLVHFPKSLSQSYISMLCYIWSASILLNKMWWRLSEVTVDIFFVCLFVYECKVYKPLFTYLWCYEILSIIQCNALWWI